MSFVNVCVPSLILQPQAGLTEEDLMVEEMKDRIRRFIHENNAEAVKLIQSMINQEH